MATQFCGSCGAQVSATASFCSSCGQPIVQAAQPTIPQPVIPQPVIPQPVIPQPVIPQPVIPQPAGTEWSHAQPPQQRGGRKGVVVGAVLAVLVAGGGGFAAMKLLGGGGGDLADGGKLPSAVTSDPEVAWTYDTDGEYASVTSSGDTTFVSLSDSGEIVALDKDGEELWRTGSDDASYGYGYVLPDEDLFLVQGYEDYGVGVLSLDDGEELWFDESGGSAYRMVDGGLLVSTYDEDDSTTEVSVLDPETGEAQWSTSNVDTTAATEDSVFVVVHEELKCLESSSGDEKWSVSLDVDSDDYPSVTAVEGMVAVSADEVTAYSTDDGEELWSKDGGGEESSIYANAFTTDMLYVDESDYGGDETEQTITVFDTEGERGELDVDEEEGFYGHGFEAGGTSYFLNTSDPSLYNDELERLDTYDGEVIASDKGIYSLDDEKLRFYEFDDSSAAWELDVESGEDYGKVYAGDGVVYTLIDAELTAYR